MEEGRDLKLALARKAASLVEPGQFVFLDSSSANLALVACLPEDCELTLATNSIDIAAAALRRPDLQLVLVGGAVAPCRGCASTPANFERRTDEPRPRLRRGLRGFRRDGRPSAYELSDATFKRALLAVSEERRSRRQRAGARAPHRVAELKDIGVFVVEHDADAERLSEIAAAGWGPDRKPSRVSVASISSTADRPETRLATRLSFLVAGLASPAGHSLSFARKNSMSTTARAGLLCSALASAPSP